MTEQCHFEGCDRPKLPTSTWCKAHRQQERRGRPLKPIGKTPHNKKYTHDATCTYEGCDNPIAANWLCGTHDWQLRKYGYMWAQGRKPVKTKTKTYSETMTCDYCRETKHWQKFCLGLEGRDSVCRACWRNRLSEDVRGPLEGQTNKVGTQTLLEMLDAAMSRNERS